MAAPDLRATESPAHSSGSHPLAAGWSLCPKTVYLNHGSFGPSPRVVQEARERWSRLCERQPMRFFCQQMEDELEGAAEAVARFTGTTANRVVLLENATLAMNVVAASIALQPGDEVLLTDHEYGAVRNIWQARCRATGASVVTAELPFPPVAAGVVDAISARLTPRTRLLVVSHITSATACRLPVEEICRLASARDVPVCIDGPHALAMLDLRLDDLGCAFYCASGHKWLCAPMGSGFLWVHPEFQSQIRSPVVSWGGSISGRPASWKDRLTWTGTRDPAPLLAMSEAIRFFQNNDGLRQYREHAHQLVVAARRKLLAIPGVGPFCTRSEDDFVSMAAVQLPAPEGWKPGYHGHPDALQLALRENFGIEVPVASWNGRRFLRVSAHLYNSMQDIDRLLAAMHDCRSLIHGDSP